MLIFKNIKNVNIKIFRFISWFILIVFQTKYSAFNLSIDPLILALLPLTLIAPYILALPFIMFAPRTNIAPLMGQHFYAGLSKPIIAYQLKATGAQNLNMFARGTPFFPIVIIKGDIHALPTDQAQALLLHEIAHLRHWHVPIIYAVLLAIYALSPNFLLLAAALARCISRYFEFKADEYSARNKSCGSLISALVAIQPKRPMEWIEFVPLLNLFLSHPATYLRIDRLKILRCNPSTTLKV